MPVRRRGKDCYQWGTHGRVYCGPGAYQKAARQGRAAYSRGYRGEEEMDRKLSPRTAGADYAHEQLAGSYFQDWIHEQIAEAEEMRRADPSSVVPTDTPAGARKVARNMLQQLEWDTKRELNITAVGFEAGDAKEFYEGFDEELHKPVTVEWLTDIVLRGSEEVPKGMREASGPQAGDRVRAHWTHGGRGYSATGTVERVLKHDVKVKLDEDAGDHFKRGFVVTVPIEKSRDNRIEIVGGRETRETREAHAEGWIIASNDKHELSVDMSDFYEETHPLFSSKVEAEKAIKNCFPGNEDQFKAKRSARFIPAGQETREARAEVMTPEQREIIVTTLRRYGADLSADGFITNGGKVLGVRPEVKKGRLRMISTNGDVLATYPISRIDSGVANFVERFWYWKPAIVPGEARESGRCQLAWSRTPQASTATGAKGLFRVESKPDGWHVTLDGERLGVYAERKGAERAAERFEADESIPARREAAERRRPVAPYYSRR